MRPHHADANATTDVGSGIERSILDSDGVFKNHISTTAVKVGKLPTGDTRLSINLQDHESAVLLSPKEAAHLARLLSATGL
jgi:hypothetical protein